MKLNYKAVSQQGKTVQGVIEAKDIEEAAKYLRSKDLIPIRVIPRKDFQINLGIFNASRKDLVFFTRQLSSMITAGLTLMQSLRTLESQMPQGKLKKVLVTVISDIEDGNSLAESLGQFPEIFNSTYLALIKAAETSGLLDKVLSRLADNLEKEQKIRSNVKGALLYPIIVVIGMVIVMAVMMIVVVPELTPIYTELNVQLPFQTRVVVALSDFTINYWYVVIAGVVGLYFLYKFWKRTENGILITSKLALILPVFGKLNHDTILTEVTRTF